MTDPLERAERLTVSEALDIAAAIDNSDKDISSWEAKFLDDIMAQLGREASLSPPGKHSSCWRSQIN